MKKKSLRELAALLKIPVVDVAVKSRRQKLIP